MIGSRFQSPPTGMGIIPLILGAAAIGAGIYQKKQEQKAAEEQAKAAEKAAELAAKKRKAAASGGVSKWLWIGLGTAAVAGVGLYVLMKRRSR